MLAWSFHASQAEKCISLENCVSNLHWPQPPPGARGHECSLSAAGAALLRHHLVAVEANILQATIWWLVMYCTVTNNGRQFFPWPKFVLSLPVFPFPRSTHARADVRCRKREREKAFLPSPFVECTFLKVALLRRRLQPPRQKLWLHAMHILVDLGRLKLIIPCSHLTTFLSTGAPYPAW